MEYAEIRTHLHEVFYAWLDSIDDLALVDHLKEHAFIAGGAIASLLQDETPRDYDIFFTLAETKQRVEAYYENHADLVYIQTQNALTLFSGVQLITRQWGFPDAVTGGFDYVHTQGYFYRKALVFSADVEYAAQNKLLWVNRQAPCPLHPLLRLPKFIARGYTIEQTELIEIGKLVNSLDLSDEEVVSAQIRYMYESH